MNFGRLVLVVVCGVWWVFLFNFVNSSIPYYYQIPLWYYFTMMGFGATLLFVFSVLGIFGFGYLFKWVVE